MQARGRIQQRGFTLVEVGITVAILALAAAVIIPGMNNISRADLRKSASGLSTTVRSSYDNAALSGKTYRLVFSPGKSVVKVQATEASLSFDEKNGAFFAAAQMADELNGIQDHPPGADDSDKGHDKAPPKKPEKKKDGEQEAGGVMGALLGINKLGDRSAASGFEEHGVYEMSEHVRVLDVWTDGMDTATSEGEAYLYFFPNGYTQEALIHLEDAEKRMFTVKVSPLTGRCEVMDNYVEIPK